MHPFFFSIALVSLQIVQPAVPAVSGSDWQRVQALPIATSIQVATKTGHGDCKLKNVDANTLTCTHGKDIVFQRADILTVKVSRRGHPALVGMAIGAGAGVVAGIASGGCPAKNDCYVSRPAGAVVFAIPGAGIGALIGFFTKPAKSTVYTAP